MNDFSPSCLCYKKPQEYRESVLKTPTMAKVSVYLFAQQPFPQSKTYIQCDQESVCLIASVFPGPLDSLLLEHPAKVCRKLTFS